MRPADPNIISILACSDAPDGRLFITEDELLGVLAARVERAGSQKAVATELGISQPYLHDVLNGRRSIAPLAPRLSFAAEAQRFRRVSA